MEKHTNKKLFAGILAMSCAFVMSGCDPVESLPANYNDPILEYLTGDKVETSDNIMGEIYNKIASDKNNKVLQIVLDELAEKRFGTYKELDEAYTQMMGGNESKMRKFIEEDHAEVFVREDDGKAKNTTAKEIQKNRFINFYEDIQKRISEEFYNLITSSSYTNDEGMFSEEKLWKTLKYEFWDLKSPASTSDFKLYYVTSELTKENATDSNHLNIDLYSNSGKVGSGDTQRDARGYIEKKIFPQILKEKLVEEYIYNNNYNSLGRSYARNVNFVKVSYDESSYQYIDYIMNRFTEENVFISDAKRASSDYEVKLDFSVLEQTINGFEKINPFDPDQTSPLVPLTKVGDKYVPYSNDPVAQQAYDFNDKFTPYREKEIIEIDTTGEYSRYYTTLKETSIFGSYESISFFGDTKLGKLIKDYKKAVDGDMHGENNATEEEKAALSKFSGDDSMADALKNQIVALANSSISNDGWYVKNSGISDLPSALKDRLFNINVANDLDKTNVNDGAYVLETEDSFGAYQYPAGDTSKPKLTKTPYVRNIQGRKLVMAAKSRFTNNNNFVYDENGSAFYICQVLEAPSTPKLNTEKITTAYTTGSGAQAGVDYVKIENIAREITKILGTKDSYYTNAYTKCLEEYKFIFNDTSLYEHFKSSYPDIFEDED